MRPLYSTAIRSQVSAMIPRSWVTRTMLIDNSRRRRSSSFRIWSCIVTSSAVVGSSASSSFGPPAERNGEHRALPHAAGELVRVAREAPPCVGNADNVQQFDGARTRGSASQAKVLCKAFGDLSSDGQHRVQRGHRLLKHDGDFPAAQRPQLRFRQSRQVTPSPEDVAAGLRNARQQTKDGAQRQALTRTGFAYDAEYLAGVDVEAELLHGHDVADTHG